MPDITYQSGEFDYYYETDWFSRVDNFSTDSLQLTTRPERLWHNSNTPGKLFGDHAGHLAGDRFGGSGELDNLISQSSEVNLSTYKRIENEWARAIRDGKRVEVDVRIRYEGFSTRPSGFDITYYIDGKKFTRYLKN